MSFSDLFFLFLFLPVCLLVYNLAKTQHTRNVVLVLFSLIFYAWAEPLWIILLIFSAAFNWFLARLLIDQKGTRAEKPILAIAIIVNIAMLLVFKYTGFFVENFNLLFRTNFYVPEMAQPIGLSFYTFRAISYILDVYWQKSRPQKSFDLFLLYLSFFPHMTAGPITRYETMEKELTSRKVTSVDMYEGVIRLTIGLAKKVIIANNLNVIVEALFGGSIADLSLLGTWYTAAMYMLYIYFDFSGYSDMAIGIAQMFGFRLKENFNYPFMCKNIAEFWQRWHISLGTFFRDYLLYIPLFGKRRKYVSLFLVWFCTGFWHGASWNYILWGLYYGCFIFMEEKLGRKRLKAWPTWWKHLYSILVIIIGQGIYYCTDLSKLGPLLLNLTGISQFINHNGLIDIVSISSLKSNLFLVIAAVVTCFPIVPKVRARFTETRSDQTFAAAKIAGMVIAIALLVICSIMLVDSTNSPFLYWDF